MKCQCHFLVIMNATGKLQYFTYLGPLPTGLLQLSRPSYSPELKSWLRPWGRIGKGGIGPPTFWLLPPPIHIVLYCANLVS